jgi:hypothetical protein
MYATVAAETGGVPGSNPDRVEIFPARLYFVNIGLWTTYS